MHVISAAAERGVVAPPLALYARSETTVCVCVCAGHWNLDAGRERNKTLGIGRESARRRRAPQRSRNTRGNAMGLR